MQLSKHYAQQIGFIQQPNLPYTVQLTFSFLKQKLYIKRQAQLELISCGFSFGMRIYIGLLFYWAIGILGIN